MANQPENAVPSRPPNSRFRFSDEPGPEGQEVTIRRDWTPLFVTLGAVILALLLGLSGCYLLDPGDQPRGGWQQPEAPRQPRETRMERERREQREALQEAFREVKEDMRRNPEVYGLPRR